MAHTWSICQTRSIFNQFISNSSQFRSDLAIRFVLAAGPEGGPDSETISWVFTFCRHFCQCIPWNSNHACLDVPTLQQMFAC